MTDRLMRTTIALAVGFAAAVVSIPVYTATAEAAQAEALTADLLSSPPAEYFPGKYDNQAKEMEPSPPTF